MSNFKYMDWVTCYDLHSFNKDIEGYVVAEAFNGKESKLIVAFRVDIAFEDGRPFRKRKHVLGGLELRQERGEKDALLTDEATFKLRFPEDLYVYLAFPKKDCQKSCLNLNQLIYKLEREIIL